MSVIYYIPTYRLNQTKLKEYLEQIFPDGISIEVRKPEVTAVDVLRPAVTEPVAEQGQPSVCVWASGVPPRF